MADIYHAGVYWKGRKESAEECARRAATFHRMLSRCDPLYERWFEQADSLEEARSLRFEPEAETFLRLFGKGDYRLGDEGFSFSAWTGHEESGVGGRVRLRCGTDAEVAPNLCLLSLPWPEKEPEGRRILRAPVLTEVMRAMVLAWEPDWGVITSDELREALSPEGDVGTFVGWLTWFSHRWGEVPPLPEPVRLEPVADQGTLVLLTPEPPTASNPDHLALGRQVQQVLFERGLLRWILS